MKRLFALFMWLWAFPALAANPVFVADGNYGWSGTSPVAVPIPNGSIANGQLMIMYVCAVDFSTAPTITTPTNWTLYTTFTNTAGGGGYVSFCSLYWKIASSEGSSVSVSFAGSGSLAGGDGHVRVYKNTRTTNPFNQVQSVYVSSGTGTNQTVTIPAFTETYVSGEVYVAAWISQHNFDQPTGTNFTPNVSNVFANTGTIEGYSLGDYSPGSQPGTMVINMGSNNEDNIHNNIGVGLTILPQSSGVEGLPLTKAGR